MNETTRDQRHAVPPAGDDDFNNAMRAPTDPHAAGTCRCPCLTHPDTDCDCECGGEHTAEDNVRWVSAPEREVSLRDAWREARRIAETTDGITWDLPELRTHQADRVNLAKAQAIAYVWGRQDAGESVRDTGYSLDFGDAYGRRMHMYVTECTSSMPNIQAAFEQWRATRQIEF